MKFEILGIPIAKERHRTARIKGKSLSYDPQGEEKERIRNKLKFLLKCAQLSNDPIISKEALELPYGEKYSLMIESHHPIPKNATKALKMQMEDGMEHNKKPDWDNVGKFYSDCANGIFYSDDSKIVKANVEKYYSNTPKVWIYISRLD